MKNTKSSEDELEIIEKYYDVKCKEYSHNNFYM